MSDPDPAPATELAHGTTMVEADYFQFHVTEPDTIEITTPDLLNGLVATDGDGAMIGTGVKIAAHQRRDLGPRQRPTSRLS